MHGNSSGDSSASLFAGDCYNISLFLRAFLLWRRLVQRQQLYCIHRLLVVMMISEVFANGRIMTTILDVERVNQSSAGHDLSQRVFLFELLPK